MTFFCSKTRGE